MLSHRDEATQRAYDEFRATYQGACVFCDQNEGVHNIPVAVHDYFSIIPNRFPYSVWDATPVHAHYMIVPRRHITHFTDFTAEESAEFFRLVTAYEGEGYSLYSRAPANTKRTVSHHHAHLIKLDVSI